jgi:hypothetical protein
MNTPKISIGQARNGVVRIVVNDIFVREFCSFRRAAQADQIKTASDISPVGADVKKSSRQIWVVGTGALLLLGCATAAFLWGNSDYIDCQRYDFNNSLNGGVKVINGRRYTINICGSGINDSYFFGDGMDSVQLQILNERGELLAERRYKVFWGGRPGHEPIVIGQDSITYQDDERQEGYTIDMPPTTVDWIKARLPLFN